MLHDEEKQIQWDTFETHNIMIQYIKKLTCLLHSFLHENSREIGRQIFLPHNHLHYTIVIYILITLALRILYYDTLPEILK